MNPSKGRTVKLYAICLAVAVAVTGGLHVFSGYAATYATAVIESGRELSGGEMLLIGSGNLIAKWFIVIAAALLGAAIASARALDRRAGSEGHTAGDQAAPASGRG